MTFLLDTNIVSELQKKRPNAFVLKWFESTRSADLYLSVLVLGEIRQGIERLRRREPTRANLYSVWMESLRRDFADRLLSVSEADALEWGRFAGAGTSVPPIDGLLAATARVHDLTLVTRNVTDVARTGVVTLNPFEE